MTTSVIVISPVATFQSAPFAGWQYYNVPAEFPPLSPFAYWLRWANYPWAYQPPGATNIVSRVAPP